MTTNERFLVIDKRAGTTRHMTLTELLALVPGGSGNVVDTLAVTLAAGNDANGISIVNAGDISLEREGNHVVENVHNIDFGGDENFDLARVKIARMLDPTPGGGNANGGVAFIAHGSEYGSEAPVLIVRNNGIVAFVSAIEGSFIDAGSHRIANVAAPEYDNDAATKKYVDDNAGSGSGNVVDTLAATLAAGNDANALRIVNLAAPVNANDAATKQFVADSIAAIPGAGGGTNGVAPDYIRLSGWNISLGTVVPFSQENCNFNGDWQRTGDINGMPAYRGTNGTRILNKILYYNDGDSRWQIKADFDSVETEIAYCDTPNPQSDWHVTPGVIVTAIGIIETQFVFSGTVNLPAGLSVINAGGGEQRQLRVEPVGGQTAAGLVCDDGSNRISLVAGYGGTSLQSTGSIFTLAKDGGGLLRAQCADAVNNDEAATLGQVNSLISAAVGGYTGDVVISGTTLTFTNGILTAVSP